MVVLYVFVLLRIITLLYLLYSGKLLLALKLILDLLGWVGEVLSLYTNKLKCCFIGNKRVFLNNLNKYNYVYITYVLCESKIYFITN